MGDGYKYPIGTEIKCELSNGQIAKIKTTGKIWVSPELGGVYEAVSDIPVPNMDSNWNVSWSTRTSLFDVDIDEAAANGGVKKWIIEA